jgi:hypothetical protein
MALGKLKIYEDIYKTGHMLQLTHCFQVIDDLGTKIEAMSDLDKNERIF